MHSKAAVFGGYGVFGGRVAQELARRGVVVRVIGRDLERAISHAEKLGPWHQGLAADLSDRQACGEAIGDASVVIHCAGPFTTFQASLVELCLEMRRHYVDIAEGREHARGIAAYGERFASAGLTAAYGCSSLPTVSSALALAAADGGESVGPALAKPHSRVRCTLFIGQDNPKGRGAVSGAASQIGRTFDTPGGERRGFGGAEWVELPAPLGRRRVFDFDSPDYDLLPAGEVRVKVGFEFWGVNSMFALAARWAPGAGRRWLPRLASATGWTRKLGTSVGAVMSEVRGADGENRSLAALARTDGQRLAALPAVYAALLLLGRHNDHAPAGVWPGYEIIGANALLRRLSADGIEILASDADGEWRQVFGSAQAPP